MNDRSADLWSISLKGANINYKSSPTFADINYGMDLFSPCLIASGD